MTLHKLAVVAIAGVLASTGCDTDDAVLIEPLISEGTTELEFSMNGFSGASLELLVDVESSTMSGNRVFESDGRQCRARLDQPGQLTADAAATLMSAFQAAELQTLGDDECAALRQECEGTTYDGDFMSVRADGGEFFVSGPCTCRFLTAGTDLQAALAVAFSTLSPIVEQVQWTGGDYEAVGPCL